MKNNVRKYREAKFLSQSDLAALVGVQAQTISHIENAKHKPRPRTARALADALGIPVAHLFSEDDDEKPAA